MDNKYGETFDYNKNFKGEPIGGGEYLINQHGQKWWLVEKVMHKKPITWEKFDEVFMSDYFILN